MVNRTKIKILHIITGLNVGGAEMMLYKSLSLSKHKDFDFRVVSMLKPGVIGNYIEDLKIPIFSLEMKRSLPTPMGLLKLIGYLRKNPPDIILGWMYHGSLLSSLGQIANRKRICY